jgi:hypothetical protein
VFQRLETEYHATVRNKELRREDIRRGGIETPSSIASLDVWDSVTRRRRFEDELANIIRETILTVEFDNPDHREDIKKLLVNEKKVAWDATRITRALLTAEYQTGLLNSAPIQAIAEETGSAIRIIANGEVEILGELLELCTN